MRRGDVAKAEARQKILEAEREQELARLSKEQLAPQEIEKKRVEIAADAEAEKRRREAQGEADAELAKYLAEAEGTQKVLEAKAEGYRQLMEAAGAHPQVAPTLLLIEQMPQLVAEQVKAIQNLKIDKITVWDGGRGQTIDGPGGGTRSATADFLAGMIGGMTGNFLSPKYADAFGIEALTWLIAPGLLVTALLAFAIHPVSHRAHDAHETHASLTADDRRERWQVVWILYAGNVIRFTVNMALIYLIIAWSRRFVLAGTDAIALDDQLAIQASQLNGPLQASMQVGMGGAGLIAGLVLRPAFEKRALFLLPMLGAAAIVLIPHADRVTYGDALGGRGVQATVFALCVIAGVGFGGLVRSPWRSPNACSRTGPASPAASCWAARGALTPSGPRSPSDCTTPWA